MAQRRIAIIIQVQGANQAKKSIDKVNKGLKNMSFFADLSAKSLTKHVTLARMVSGAYTNLTRAFVFGIKQAVSFELAMKKIAVIAGISGDNLDSLEQKVRSLAAVSPKTATEVALASLAMSKLGLSGKDIEDSLEGVIGLSVALGEAVENTGEAMVNIKNVFSKNASELTKIADEMFKAFASSALNLEKFRTAFAFAGSVARLTGIDFQQLTALMGILSNSGIRASTIGTQLRSIFLDLSSSTSKAGKAIGGATIKSKGLAEVLRLVKKNVVEAGNAKEVFGKRAVSVIDILTRNIEKFEEFSEEIKKATGDTKEASDVLGDTMANAAKRVSSSFTELNIQLSKIYSPVTITGLKTVAAILDGLTKEAIDPKDRGIRERTKELLEVGKLERQIRQISESNLDKSTKILGAGGLPERGEADRKLREEQEKLSNERARERLTNLEKELSALKIKAELSKLGLTSEIDRLAIASKGDELAKAFISHQDEQFRNAQKAIEAANFALGIRRELGKENEAESKRIQKNSDLLAKFLRDSQETFAKMDEETKKLQEDYIKAADGARKLNEELEFTNQLTSRLGSSGSQSIERLSNALVASISNAENFGDTMKTLGNVFRGVVIQMISQMIALAIKFAIFKALIGIVSGGSGTGLSLLSSFTGFASPKLGPGFAHGFDGVVRQPTNMLVGEAGPERVQVTSSAKTARGNEQGNINIIVEGSIIDKDGFISAVNSANEGIGRRFVNV